MLSGITFEEATAVPDGAILALTDLRAADIRGGQKILIYGASGSIGTAAVQLAKHLGADVTAVCNQERRARPVARRRPGHRLPAEDFTKNGERYDVIFDAVGKHSFGRCRRSLKRGGIYVGTDLGFLAQNPVLALATRWVGDKRVLFPLPRYTKQDILFLKELIEAGTYRAVIDRRISVGGRRRGTSVCRDAAEDGERRPDSRGVSALSMAFALPPTQASVLPRNVDW